MLFTSAKSNTSVIVHMLVKIKKSTKGKIRVFLSLAELKYFHHELPLLHSVNRNHGNTEVSYSVVYVEITKEKTAAQIP